MFSSTSSIAPILLGAGLFTACAATPVPPSKVASSAAAIRAAEELRADDTPAAQLRLQYAHDEYAAAQRLIADGESQRAERLLARAEADAELAVAIAKQVRSERAAAAAQAEVQTVNAK